MTLATFKDLCLDATDPARLAAFWATALGLSDEALDGGDHVLRRSRSIETIWVNAVVEPKTTKHRVHLDLDVGSLARLLDAGATVVRAAEDSGFHWTQLVDPEGGEFCAFVRDHLEPDDPARLYEVGVDATDGTSQPMAQWWADVFGGTSVQGRDGLWWVEDVDPLPFATFDMAPVPEPKTVKNRVHWDVTCDDVPALVDRGASILRAPDDEVSWHVLADPWGNEFCAFAPA